MRTIIRRGKGETAMRAIKRLARVENRFVPPVYEKSLRVAELPRERRRRYLEASGQPFHEPQSPLPADYNGPPLGIAETLRLKRER